MHIFQKSPRCALIGACAVNRANTVCCINVLEPSRRDGSNDGSQSKFLWKNGDNYL